MQNIVGVAAFMLGCVVWFRVAAAPLAWLALLQRRIARIRIGPLRFAVELLLYATFTLGFIGPPLLFAYFALKLLIR